MFLFDENEIPTFVGIQSKSVQVEIPERFF
jgi:hypothetical protein